ncbi:50S ribosomal protein L11 methyltransferase [Wenzhouxiangella sp. EGI_FJ10305]|uniref:50S ribosomal protein L11 methyltransferase n=1 Tax=Wenzhouxiangella sp. EGI_FJ10305 TaxID=3243768 RepID=UPI0035E2E2B9
MNEPTDSVRWLQVRVTVDEPSVDEAEAALSEAGAHAVTLLDAADVPVHEPDPGSMPMWPQTIVEGLFDADVDRALIGDALADAGLAEATGSLRFSELVEQDWERAWMDRYEPMRFGRDLWICPSHLEPDPDWPLVIRLDPGLAFGSGTHPTTALCLEWIDGMDLDGREVLDFGCGSGVLAIAAGLKGAGRLVAVDHDAQALLATEENARRNGLDGEIECLLPEAFERQPDDRRLFDLVLANILAAPLVELAPKLAACLRPGATLVLSGILPEQAESVIEAYADLGLPLDHSEQDEWVRLVFSRRASEER